MLLSLAGCAGLKNIGPDDRLFTKHQLNYIDAKPESKQSVPAAQEVLQPQPNNKFLWMRPALARNNMLSDSAKQKKFWKNKVAEPITISNTIPKTVARAMENRIYHTGYFQNSVTYDTVYAGTKRASLLYHITFGKPYRLGDITFPKPINDLTKQLDTLKAMTFLKTGNIYSLNDIKFERARIDLGLKEKGYINFNSDFLIIQADSVSSDHVVNLKIDIKPKTPPESIIPYRIGNVFIHDDYSLEDYDPDTLTFGSYHLITDKGALNFEALKNGVFLNTNDLYSRTNHTQTIRYLGDLPIIRYANVRFAYDSTDDRLNTLIYLTQKKKYAYSAEFNAIFRSTNYFGPGFIFSYSNRNANRGAELFKVNLRGRFEVQIEDGAINPAYELGLELNYQLPRLYPGFLTSFGKFRLPKTNISTGYNLFNRLDLYRLNSFYINFGYKWSPNDRIKHTLNPIETIFTSVPVSSMSEEFMQYLRDNPGLARTFEDQFVIGASYDFTYNPIPKGRSEFYFNGGLDASGNVLYGLFSVSGAEKDSLGRYTAFGLPFSQYMRFRTDFRYGFNISKKTSIASRFVVGLGVPYKNSTILPYVKQFYVGGTNSLRSYLARSVGPGSEVPPEGFNDLTGDIRLEANLELRFTISGNLKSAVFLDAGNIWLYNEEESRPNGVFRADTFYKEIALSTGWGLRWDFDFVIARIDFGYTLRKPYLPEGERWTFKDIRILNPVWNIAIGYPF